MLGLDDLRSEIAKGVPTAVQGHVISLQGVMVNADLPRAAQGDLCRISCRRSGSIPAVVVGFKGCTVSLAPLACLHGIEPGASVYSESMEPSIAIGMELLGRVVDALGNPIDDGPCLRDNFRQPIHALPPQALKRTLLSKQLETGIAAIDLCVPIAYGQRLALVAPAGVGKSTLLAMIARNADVDCSVIALVGERGREVREFLEEVLGEAGRAQCVTVVATSDEPAQRRALAPYTATAIAEYFRSRGKRVLLLVDSLTRTARAMREVGLAVGELPVRHGYPASVFSELPALLERTGSDQNGSITALYALLGDRTDGDDPLVEEIKSLLDGHIFLSSEIAQRGIRPAIDIPRSLSRVSSRILGSEENKLRETVSRILARLDRDREIVLLGGTPDEELKLLLQIEPMISELFSQSTIERCDRLMKLASLQALLAKFSLG